MLVEEMGPFDIFEFLRLWFYKCEFRVLDCFYCTSVWVSFFLCLGAGYWWLFLPVSAVAIFLQIVHEKLA